MQKFVFFLALSLSLGAREAIAIEDCHAVSEAESMRVLQNKKSAYEPRSRAATCLVKKNLDHIESARLVLKVLNDSHEDLFLREDIVDALGDTRLRRSVKVEGKLGPEMGQQEKAAVDRTVSSASNLLALSAAVKSMDEIVPLTRLENEFFRALSDIAQNDGNHVVLRSMAVDAMEKMTKQVVESGVYEDKTVRVSQEALKVIGARDDNGSFFSGAQGSYERLAQAGLPGFVTTPNRALASVKSAPAAAK